MFYLTTHSTHVIYGYMASDIWLRTILIVRKETRCRHIGYSYRLAARVLLYAPSHRQDSTYHSLCYTSRGALAGMRNTFMRSLTIIGDKNVSTPLAAVAMCVLTVRHPIYFKQIILFYFSERRNFKNQDGKFCTSTPDMCGSVNW